jgi:hypothetical protein
VSASSDGRKLRMLASGISLTRQSRRPVIPGPLVDLDREHPAEAAIRS